MRQPTTAELRLDEHKAASFGPAGPSILPFWLSTSRLRSNFVAADPPRDGRSRPTTSVSGKCRLNHGPARPAPETSDIGARPHRSHRAIPHLDLTINIYQLS